MLSRQRRMGKHVPIVMLFFILTVIITYPLFFRMNSSIPGFYSTDEPYGAIWDLWRMKYSWNNHISLSHTPLIGYPAGVDMHRAGYVAYLNEAVSLFLTVITGPVMAYNLPLFFNLFLSGIFTYLLAYWLTKNRPAAVISGAIFAFCPYQFAHLWQHPGLTYNELLPLALLAAALLFTSFSRWAVFLFIIAMLLLFSFDLHIVFFGLFIIGVFLIYLVFFNWRKKLFSWADIARYYRRIFGLGLLVLVILLPQYLPFIIKSLKFSAVTQAAAFNAYHRPFDDLFMQSAKPLSYFLPAAAHPLWGRFTENFLATPWYGLSLTEHTLYLGWIALILALVAVKKWKKNQASPAVPGKPGDNFYIGFFIALAVAAWLFSQPPWWRIGPFKLFMPSYFMYKILPMLRAYCRFGIVLSFAVAMLAGFGLKFLLEKIRSVHLKYALSFLFLCLILLDFWNYPPFRVIDVTGAPAAYRWIKDRPGDFVIAEYPLDANSPNEMYKFYQTKHEKKMINGSFPNTSANTAIKGLTDMSDPETARTLAGMGVQYILVHEAAYRDSELIKDMTQLNGIFNNKGLRLVRSFPAQKCAGKNILCTEESGAIDIFEVIK